MRRAVTTTQTSERHFFDRPAADKLDIATQIPQNLPATPAPGNLPAKALKRIRIGCHQVRQVFSAVPEAFGREYDRGNFFLFVPVFAGSGAVLYFSLPGEPRLSAILFGLTVLTGLKFLAENRRQISLCLVIALSIVAGMLCAKLETLRLDTAMPGTSITTRVTGRVVSVRQAEKGGWRVTLDVVATERPQLRYGPERLVISARSIPPDTRPGTGLRGLVHLRPQSGPVRPGNYDFAFHNYYRGIGGSGFFLGKPEIVPLTEPDGIVANALLTVANIRQRLTSHILSRIEGEPGAIATSLITGQRDGISEISNNAMRLSGLSHILSISGFHMALVAAIVIGALRGSMAFFPEFAARYPIRKFAAFAALLASAFYLLLSGLDVAAQRSFVMLAVILLAMTVDRAALSLRNVALAALVTIAIAPHEILGPGFQMSYSATTALIAFYSWWSPWKANRAGRRARSSNIFLQLPAKLVNHVNGIAMTSLVAGSASAIFAAYHFNNTAPLGLVGNAVALPVVSVLVMPFAVLALLLMPFDLDFLPFAVMEQGIKLVMAIATCVAGLSPGGNLGPMPQTSLLLLSAGLVILLLFSSWLRLCGLPFLAAGVIVMTQAALPDIVLSEDGRLIGLRYGKSLAVNRSQGGSFSLNNWQQGYGLEQLAKPARQDAGAADGAFECEGKLCIAREPGGLIIAYTDDPVQKEVACNDGNIVVLAFAGVTATCNRPDILVITQRDLAMKGAAEFRFETAQKGQGSDADADVQAALDQRLRSVVLKYAIGPPERPWNAYRVHSRAARNLPERIRKQTDKSIPNTSERDAAIDQ